MEAGMEKGPNAGSENRDRKRCEYARSLASLLPFLTSDPVGGALSPGTPGKGGQDGGRFYTWGPNASYRKKHCLFSTTPAPTLLTSHCTLLEPAEAKAMLTSPLIQSPASRRVP